VLLSTWWQKRQLLMECLRRAICGLRVPALVVGFLEPLGQISEIERTKLYKRLQLPFPLTLKFDMPQNVKIDFFFVGIVNIKSLNNILKVFLTALICYR
jgi:hypothetical protein